MNKIQDIVPVNIRADLLKQHESVTSHPVKYEEVVFVPATMYKKVYYQHHYECPTCKSDGADAIKKAPVPKQPITHSPVSPSVLAQLLHQKIELSLPFYCLEKE